MLHRVSSMQHHCSKSVRKILGFCENVCHLAENVFLSVFLTVFRLPAKWNLPHVALLVIVMTAGLFFCNRRSVMILN